jgi:predicted signal transduction protein with EAL and GGDEF domain
VAERARSAVEAAFENDSVPLTISFGVVARPTHGLAAATLIRAADRALYEAKAKDRNRIVAPPAVALATASVRELDRAGPRYRVPSRRDPQQALRG